jgi:altronate dehydratase
MKPVLVISDRDNVATALEPLEAGRELEAGGVHLVASERIPAGHKIALHRIPAGASVFKYGSPIGTAISDIAPGSHVHVHNVASARGRGDLEPGPARLAEPPDTASIPRTS